MSMRLSFCVKAATSLDADDLDTLTAGIEGYVKTGVGEREAEKMALDDLIAEVARERVAIVALAREQYPDLFRGVDAGRVGPAAEPNAAMLQDRESAPAAEPVKAKEAAPRTKIDDFGQKLEGARKDYATILKDAESVDIAAEPLSVSWPEPDYQKLLDGGADPYMVAFTHAARDELPTKPQKAWKLKGWVDQVELLRGLSQKLLSGEVSRDRVQSLLVKDAFGTLRKAVGSRAELYETFGHDRSMKGITFAENYYSLYKGQKNVTKWVVEQKAKATMFSNWPRELAVGDTKAEMLDNFKAKLATLDTGAKAKGQAQFVTYRKRGQTGAFVGKKIGREYIDLHKAEDVTAARKYMQENVADLEKALEAYKQTPFERKTENQPRVGDDHRNGAPVTPEIFSETFGFRGVQFGNYVEQGRRQSDLNQAFDGLMDMAAVLGIPPRAISLNGKLGLAFGARGRGGNNAPAAHYEPGNVVINLTKGSGPGSLAHEWWHSLDNYFGKESGTGGYGTGGTLGDKTRAEMKAAFDAVKKATQAKTLRQRSAELDKRKSKPYWDTPIELSARSFEMYVIAKLQDQGAANDYLANVVSKEFWDAQEALRAGLLTDTKPSPTFPYPIGDEMPAVRASFDEFFKTVQTRTDDAGNVAMFSRTTEPTRGLTLTEAESIADAIRQANPTAPEIVVLEFVNDAPAALLRDIQAAGAANDVEAAYHDGKVYAFAPHIATPKRAVFVIARHELRHHGMRSLDRSLSTTLAGMVMRNPDLKVAAQAKVKDGLAKDIVAGAEEALADWPVEKIESLTGWDKMVAAVRNWLRKMAQRLRDAGHGTLADAIDPKDWTDRDVAAFVARAEEVSRGGTAGPQQPAMAFSRAPRITTEQQDGAPVFASDDITIAFPQDTERFEVIPAAGERVVNYAIMPAEGFDVLGHVELLVRDGQPVSLLDIEITPDGRRQGAGRKTIEALLAANPDADLNISNIVTEARGFWSKMGVPEQNLEDGAAYDGTLNWETYSQAANGGRANRSAQANRGAREGRDARAEGGRAGAAGQASGLTAFSRAGPGLSQRAPIQQALRNNLTDLLSSAGAKVSWWDKTLGTQYAKAQKFPAFKRVFDRVQQYLEDTSSLANEAAGQAKSILPKLETWKDLKNFGIDSADAKAIAGPVFTGTLTDKKVYSNDELRSKFKLTDKQIGQYREFLAAVNTSLDQAVAADVLKLVGDKNPGLREIVIGDRRAFRRGLIDYLTEQANDGDDASADLLERVREKYERIDQLKEEGYAPLMRFGEYKVHVTDADGQTLYFGLYETKAAANQMARDLGEDPEFAGATIEQGVLSKEQYKLFSGVPLDSMEMFANAIGADKSEVFQEFLKIAKSNRSALKRLIHRKGTAGFSEDVPRVLASFVTSNARMAAGSLNLAGAKEEAQGIRDGDVQDEAIKLIDTVENPTETAGMFRGLMFMNFIGGSIASAVVNLTQPVTMTLPYLSQWGGATKAAARLMAAGKMAASGKVDDMGLRAALMRAEKDGIVSPQEIHHLTAQAMGTWGKNPMLQRAAFVWAAPFSLAEQFNRRATFIAAYNTAKSEGVADPFEFAEKAVSETQGLYNKGNAPNWARNPIGASALTFKQFSIHYLEWMGRMYRSGPQGKRAVLLALAMLMLAAGTDGLPGADDLDDLIDTIGQALGYDTNSKKARRDFIANELGMGDEMADVLARGFSALPGIPLDVSLRMSMGNLVPGSGLFLRSNTDRSRDLLEVAGPAGGIAKQYMDAGQKLLAGNVGEAAVAATPVALQNVSKAVGMWTTGEARDTAGRRVMEADSVDGLMRFLGFNPQAIARESEKMGMIRRSEQLAKNVEGEIAARWARAFADGDREAVADAKQELADWNEANPDQRIKITGSQILQRVKKLRQDRSQRFITSISPERRGAVSEVLQ